jgi:hypothetical protein
MTSASRLVLAAIVALPVTVSNSASAQISQTRQDLWFNGGVGYGSFGCENCDGREGALSGGRLRSLASTCSACHRCRCSCRGKIVRQAKAL